VPDAFGAVALAGGPAAQREVWGTDFKGWFRTQDGSRIDPLTLSDLASRYLLCCESLGQATYAQVQPVFVAAFREYGLPTVIRSDNGPPFASVGLGGVAAGRLVDSLGHPAGADRAGAPGAKWSA
jgi:transposase InsO family protein